MTSKFHLPSPDRLRRLTACGDSYHVKRRNGTIEKLRSFTIFSAWISLSELLSLERGIICATRSEIEDIDRFLELGTFYRIPLDQPGLAWTLSRDILTRMPNAFVKGRKTSLEIIDLIDQLRWNEYAIHLLRYGLLKYPVYTVYRSAISKYKNDYQKRMTCKRCYLSFRKRDFFNRLVELRKFQPRNLLNHFSFQWEIIWGGFGFALLVAFPCELGYHYLVRKKTKNIKKLNLKSISIIS